MPAHVTMYTDGACKSNPGPGGWACVLLAGGKELAISGGEPDTTNNRMELLGVISGLERLGDSPCVVNVISDSQYIVNAINQHWIDSWRRNGWARADGELKNPDLWQRLDKLLHFHACTFQWVKGHNGNQYNEMCDKLAVQESNKHSYHARNMESASVSDEEIADALRIERNTDKTIQSLTAALQDALTKYHNLDAGLDYPCGLYSYCHFCKEAVHRCASAFLREREANRT